MLILKKCTHLFEITENHLLYMEIVGKSKEVWRGVCVWRKWVCVYIKFRVDTEQERKKLCEACTGKTMETRERFEKKKKSEKLIECKYL